IEQVNKAVAQMEEMTQQNASLVEEANAASHSMADQARTLNDMMARYRVSDARAARTAAAPKSGAVARLDRRSVARRWSGKPMVRVGGPQPIREASAAKSSDEAEWQEF